MDETLAHQRIRHAFETLAGHINRYGGVAHEIRGDALVAEFARASDAISASLAFQTENSARNAGLNDTLRPVLRIGIAMGEVVIADNTVTGEGIILAQRLEQMAENGGICLQGAAYETTPKRLPFDFENLGEHQVKGFTEPVRIYGVTLRPDAALPEPVEPMVTCTSVPQLLDKPSIAVLPFANLSQDPEQEYFSDGITEDIIAALSHFQTFPVISRNSSFTYKGQATGLQQIAEELGARYILEGSIRKSGDRLRITAQLSDTGSGHQVWSGKFDEVLDDVFEVQDQITLKIVTTIQPELAQSEIEKAKLTRTSNLSAWDLVLKGMYFVNRHTREEYIKAQDLFQRAIAIDPSYSDAWAGLAWSYLRRIELHDSDQRQELSERGMHASRRAVELDDRSSLAHYVLGLCYVWQEDMEKALNEVEVALEINPFNAQARRGLGNRLDLIGRNSEGIMAMEQALQLSPRDPNCPKLMGYLCRAYIDNGDPEKALGWIQKAVNLRPENPDLHFRKAICLAHLDRVEEARQSLDECERLKPGFLEERQEWRPYSDSERNQRIFAGFTKHKLLQ